MQSEGNANHFVSIGINFGILLLSVVPTWIVLSELKQNHEVQEHGVDALESETESEGHKRDLTGTAEEDK
jgi:hypothetical protein